MLQRLVTFPVELFVTKLSGSGQDSIFLGVIRKPQVQDMSTVRLFMTTAGTILCADDHFYNTFGVDPLSLVGRSFSSLGTDMEALQK